MSVRFAIKNTAAKAEKEGDHFIRFSGVAEPFSRVSEREVSKVSDVDGKEKLVFITGLDKERVEFFKWYTDAEKEEVKKQVEDLAPLVSRFYGGESVVNPSNRHFWGSNRDVNRLSLSNEDIDVFYDTKNPSHALLYLSIISGAFIDLVAPTREWAERYQIPHFLVLEQDDFIEDDDDVVRSDAHAALAELRKEESAEALFILAWCIQYDTNSFGAVLRSTPLRSLVNYHIQFIDGKLQSKRKRNAPKVFLEYYNKWKGQQTRASVITEAYIKAGEYFSYIQSKEKRYTTAEGTALGNTVQEAVTNIMKTKFNQDYENLREKVEAKWKE